MPRRIYQLKVSLEGAESPIWRRILVSANVTLRQAHRVLQGGQLPKLGAPPRAYDEK